MVLIGYIGAAAVLYGLWSRNPYNLLSYVDAVLWPLRRAEVAEKKGRAMLAQGQELFRDDKYVEAVVYLRAGLARVPHDLPARLSLARFYAMAGNRPMAARVLADGVGERYPGRAYLERVIQFAAESEDYESMVALADRFVEQELPASDRRWLADVRFQALLAAERGEEALAETELEPRSNVEAERRVLALLALRRHEEALGAVKTWQAQPWVDRTRALKAHVKAAQAAGRGEEMDAVLDELFARTPADPAVLAHRVVARATAGARADAEAAWEDYLFRFGGSLHHLLLVAEPAAKGGLVWLLDRCLVAAAERGYSLARLQGLRMHGCLAAGDWDGALAALQAVQSGGSGDVAVTWFDHLIAAARNSADAAQTELVEKLRSRSWPARYFLVAGDVLIRADRLTTARTVLQLGEAAFPQSGSFRRLQAELAKRVALATPMPVPSRKNWDEVEFFRQLDQLASERNWPAIEAAIEELRRVDPRPEFADRRDEDLWLQLVPVFRSRADWVALTQAVRYAAGRKTSRVAPLLALARQFRTEGDGRASLLVVEELSRQFPDSRPLQGIMAGWKSGKGG